jgi:hypothetical protein
MRFRPFALALALALPAFTAMGTPDGPRPASAAVSIQLSLDELVGHATFVVLATPMERHSAWEELPGGRRIVTYTRMSVERSVTGQAGNEVWVRTLGGTVGRIGQHVSGEARFTMGERSVVFLSRVDGAVVVTGLAQGHYPVLADPEPAAPVRAPAAASKIASARLRASPELGTILPRRGPAIGAHEQLVGATLEAAIDAISRARKAQDARK